MTNWISNLADKAMRICRINKMAAGNHRQDMTGPVLENLLGDGYTQVTWNSNGSRHAPCQDLNRQIWDLEDFLRSTEYDAPLFSRSHPGDESCTLIVTGDGLPSVEVDSYGDVDTAIGTSRPVKIPEAPKPPKVKNVPTPKEKVVEVPKKPEPKTIYVPKEVHKQIKDPFEKQISEQEKEDWLKDLEQENVEESTPAQPKYTDEEIEEWQRGLDRETKLKIPNWITGLFKG